MASVVYPGAQHTRFLHSIGAFHLVSEALLSLQQKGVFIFESEVEAVQIAILLHDIGHGPFSHVLENSLISGISHEDISLLMMEKMNREMDGMLTLAIKIFKDEYPKRFLHQLISSQLDMDRLDYLRRDSFFTGVSEGNIGSARIIKMLDVENDALVVDQKGIYSIENYLISRRLMYWQVYLHKTAVGCEAILVNLLKRAKHLVRKGHQLFASPALAYFLVNDVDRAFFDSHQEALQNYCALDDNDIWSSVKVWMNDTDPVLSMLATDLVDRRIFKVEVFDKPIPEEVIAERLAQIRQHTGLSTDDATYLMSANTVNKKMYSMEDDHITIKCKDGTCKDISQASELFDVTRLSMKNSKYYLCYQRF
jgi:HD domain protein